MSVQHRIKILVVDDEQAIAEGLKFTLEELGYEVVGVCFDASEGLSTAREKNPTLALVDIRLHGEESGIQLASVLRTELGIPVIFMTAFADDQTIARAKRSVPAGFLLKPVTDQDLRTAIEVAFARHQTVVKQAAAERLGAASRVATGLAHEVNNPLSYVSSNIEYALEAIGALERDGAVTPEKLRAIATALVDAKEGADRVRGIVADMTSFAASTAPVADSVDLGSILTAAWAIACGDARDGGGWTIDVAALPSIEGDEVQLVQLFTRLLQNAVQYRRDGARHHVSLRALTEERGVVVEITDNGRGIAREIQARVFDPFFTTRGAKAGRGLGLAIAAGVVRAHAGEITLESTLGVGTTVRVSLPRELRATRPPAADSPSPKLSKARPRVLVVDDEPAIGRSIKRMLEGDYDVRAVGDGPSALAALANTSFDAILCDVTLPGMEGTELYTEIERLHPPLASRVVFVTGGTFSRRSQAFLDSLENKTIRKPFAAEEIRSTLREMLSR